MKLKLKGELPSYFRDFLTEIRLTKSQRDDCITGHKTLRERLLKDETLAPIIVTTFLQGSYRRATAVRPYGDKRADVDVVVVTRLHESDYPDPNKAIEVFVPFLKEYYKDKYSLGNSRSICIELSYVDLDLVITSAPSEAEEGLLKSDCVRSSDTPEDIDDWRLVTGWLSLEKRTSLTPDTVRHAMSRWKAEAEWKTAPLRIPDKDAGSWEDTHPIAQMKWTWEKNRLCNGHYVNVVKALRWWKRLNPRLPKYPKGYPLEHIVGQNCPDGIESVAEGIVTSLEAIAQNYQSYVQLGTTPYIKDHGVDHNVFGSVSSEDFKSFHSEICEAAKIARKAIEADLKESVDYWQQLFGKKFPDAPDDGGDKRGDDGPKSFSPRTSVSVVGSTRFG